MWHIPALGLTLVTPWNDSTIGDDLIGQSLFEVVLKHLPPEREDR